MNKVNSNSFISTLNYANEKGKTEKFYLVREKSKFKLVRNKQLKNLKTKDIVVLAEECFNHILTGCFSNEYKRTKLQFLEKGLRGYLGRLNHSKKWFVKILDYFGYQGNQEKQLRSLLLQVDQKIISLSCPKEKIYHPQEILEEERTKIEWQLFSSKQIKSLEKGSRREYRSRFGIMKDFYHKVLGKSDFCFEPFEQDYHSNWFSFLVDLRCLKALKIFSEETRLKIGEVVNEFSFAYEIYLALTQSDSFDSLKPSILSGIVNRLKNLPLWDDPAQVSYKRLLIPGGNPNQLLLYEIKRESKVLFSFRILDSIHNDIQEREQLAKELNDIQKLIADLDKQIKEANEEQLVGLKESRMKLKESEKSFYIDLKKLLGKDTCYLIPLERLSESFFDHLLNVAFGGLPMSIDELYDDFTQSLGEEGGFNCFQGTEHGLQLKLNAETKTVTLWLKDRWGKEIHNFFKAFSSQMHMVKLKNLLMQVNSHDGDRKRKQHKLKRHKKYANSGEKFSFNILETLTQMHAEGVKTLQSRNKKLKS